MEKTCNFLQKVLTAFGIYYLNIIQDMKMDINFIKKLPCLDNNY